MKICNTFNILLKTAQKETKQIVSNVICCFDCPLFTIGYASYVLHYKGRLYCINSSFGMLYIFELLLFVTSKDVNICERKKHLMYRCTVKCFALLERSQTLT